MHGCVRKLIIVFGHICVMIHILTQFGPNNIMPFHKEYYYFKLKIKKSRGPLCFGGFLSHDKKMSSCMLVGPH